MVPYKLVIQTGEPRTLRCIKASHAVETGTAPRYVSRLRPVAPIDTAPHPVTVNYSCCLDNVVGRSLEQKILDCESDGRPEELSGIILLVMMAFQNDTKPTKTELSLNEIKRKLVARPKSFPTLENQVVSPNSVPIRCLTSSHIRIELSGNETTVAFVTTTETIKTIKVDTLEFALWGAEVLENQELKSGFDMFMAKVKAEKKAKGFGGMDDGMVLVHG
ncbi:hypothetical protein HDU76_000730 [Blyttiomyces sp. JEL0837]|nr:hypothetical protein HDU76_000730 [Blyttiomyces sp. JEL0837]